MTILYRPVLIESAEQAEALPEGTLVSVTCGPVADAYDPTKFAITPRVGDVALVPIEAEEEWTVGHESPSWAPGTEEWAREFQTCVPGRRLFRRSTTPWEEA